MSDTDWTPDFGGIGNPAPTWNPKRPMRIAILGDFGAGALSGRLDKGAELARRKPLKVEFDTLEDALARLKLKLTLPIGADGVPVEVDITEMESFHPDELYRNLEIFSQLAALRKRLNTPSSFAAAAAEMKDWGLDAGPAASRLSARGRARGATPSSGSNLDDFARLTGRSAVSDGADDSVDQLLRRIVGPFIVQAANPAKDAYLASLDKALTDAMRAVLHQPDFQNAESLWRGADFLLRKLETSHQLQVHLIDISAEEFAADLSAADDLVDTGLYKLLVEQPSQDADGGYAYIAGCYHFDATPPHAELLGRAARVAAHAGAPFITGMATDPFTDRREPPHRLIREAFEALRGMPDASYLALLGPRFMLRHPYGKKSDPISSFAFEEFDRASGLRGMLWGHPALLALSVLGVRGGQLTIDDLAFHYYIDEDGDTIALPCTDRLINTDAAGLLRGFGINAVMAHKGEAIVRLAGLAAINGDGLASAAGAPRRSASDSRAAIGGKNAERVRTDWAPATRSAGTVAMSTPAAKLAESQPEDDATVDEVGGSTEEANEETIAESSAADAPADSGDGGSGDPELDALLASLGGGDEPAADGSGAEAEAESGLDPELEALLKSLG